MSEDVSRRKAFSLLGLGAALGFALSSALGPLEAEAQEAAPAPPPRPLRPPERTACNGGKGGALVAISDGTAHARRGDEVEKPRRSPPPQQLRRNSGSICF